MNTLVLFIHSLVRHLGWWLAALLRPRDPRAPLRPRRALVLLVGMPLFLGVQTLHVLFLLLDDLLFPAYRRVDVGEALFITGIPRSGTTFVHRTLAVDAARFTTPRTWEVLFAPAISQRRIIHAAARLDACFGSHGRRGLRALTRRFGGGMADIHAVGLDAAEEDYLALLPVGGCLILLLAFPAARDLQALGRFQEVAPAHRRRLLAFYRGILQRHLHADGGQRQLLSKNAAFGSWLDDLQATFPRARFVVCVREPVAALSSQISSIAAAQSLFGTRTDTPELQAIFRDQFVATLAGLADTLPAWPPERAVIIDQADLARDADAVIRALLARLGLEPSAALAVELAAHSGRHRSQHQHRPDHLALCREDLETRLRPAYDRLRALPQCVGGNA